MQNARAHGLGWRTAHASSIDEKGLIYIYIFKATSAPPRAGTTGTWKDSALTTLHTIWGLCISNAAVLSKVPALLRRKQSISLKSCLPAGHCRKRVLCFQHNILVAFHSFLLERENFSKHGATSKSITKGLGAIERSADFE